MIDSALWAALPAWAKFVALAMGYKPAPVHTRKARATRSSRP
jgi:hypothetical protein